MPAPLINRRALLIGLVAAPAVVRVESLMRIVTPKDWDFYVSPWGDDGWPGESPYLPFATIEKAIKAIQKVNLECQSATIHCGQGIILSGTGFGETDRDRGGVYLSRANPV